MKIKQTPYELSKILKDLNKKEHKYELVSDVFRRLNRRFQLEKYLETFEFSAISQYLQLKHNNETYDYYIFEDETLKTYNKENLKYKYQGDVNKLKTKEEFEQEYKDLINFFENKNLENERNFMLNILNNESQYDLKQIVEVDQNQRIIKVLSIKETNDLINKHTLSR